MSTPATPTTSPAGGSGVQVLLDAEKQAYQQVLQARKYREQCLRDARTEAALEIEAFKRAKQEDFAAFEQSVLGSLDARVDEYARETAVQLEEIDRVANEHRGNVVQLLLTTVTTVQPKMHPNALIRQQHQQQQHEQE